MKHRVLFLLICILFGQVSIGDEIFPKIQGNDMYQMYYRELVKLQNIKLIQQFNQDPAHNFQLKENKFLQLSSDEFHSMYTTKVKTHDRPVEVAKSLFQQKSYLQTTPKGVSVQNKLVFEPDQCDSVSIDLTIHASSVKDQGSCNSCYAHSISAIVQSMMHNEYEIFYDLSEQQITECTLNWAPKGSQIFNNQGCQGGWGWKSLHYFKFIGVTLQTNYPYVSGKTKKLKKCNERSITSKRFKVKDYEAYYEKVWPESQCSILNEKLMQGKTIAVSIWAPYGIQYQFYGSATQGIDNFDMCGPYDDVNHELQLLGSTDNYWKLKNSYGTSWGQKGYLYLSKSKGLNCLNICMDFAFATEIIKDTQ